MEMKERIELLLHFKNTSPSQFAEEIGVQRSSVSHILSGRNKPSLDFIKKVVDRYPDVSYGWLIEGNGELVKAQVSEDDKKVELEDKKVELEDKQISTNQEELTFTDVDTNVNNSSKQSLKDIDTSVNSVKTTQSLKKKKIKQVIIFYDDGSFENYNA